MLVILFISAVCLFAYGLALPTEDNSGGRGGLKKNGLAHGVSYAAAGAAADCDKIFYAQFTGAICGVYVFRQSGSGVVSVETVGEISGLEVSFSPYAYHGTHPLFPCSLPRCVFSRPPVLGLC